MDMDEIRSLRVGDRLVRLPDAVRGEVTQVHVNERAVKNRFGYARVRWEGDDTAVFGAGRYHDLQELVDGVDRDASGA